MSIKVINNISNNVANEVFREMNLTSSKSYDANQLWYKDELNYNTKIINNLLGESSKLLRDSGFQIDIDKWFIEGHNYNTQDKKVSSPFAWHQDDYGGWPEKVVTILWYLEKDARLKGGDLFWCNKDPESIGLFNLVSEKPIINRIDIEEGMIVIMSGNVWHSPEDIYGGNGSRKLIVVQFKDLTRN